LEERKEGSGFEGLLNYRLKYPKGRTICSKSFGGGRLAMNDIMYTSSFAKPLLGEFLDSGIRGEKRDRAQIAGRSATKPLHFISVQLTKETLESFLLWHAFEDGFTLVLRNCGEKKSLPAVEVQQ
jgi:hypothetical protein